MASIPASRRAFQNAMHQALLGPPLAPGSTGTAGRIAFGPSIVPSEDPAEHAGNRPCMQAIHSDGSISGLMKPSLVGCQISIQIDFPKWPVHSTRQKTKKYGRMFRKIETPSMRYFPTLAKFSLPTRKYWRRGLVVLTSMCPTTFYPDEPPKDTLTPEETRGLKLFVGKAACTNCHNGPLLTNNSFHNTGLLSPL